MSSDLKRVNYQVEGQTASDSNSANSTPAPPNSASVSQVQVSNPPVMVTCKWVFNYSVLVMLIWLIFPWLFYFESRFPPGFLILLFCRPVSSVISCHCGLYTLANTIWPVWNLHSTRSDHHHFVVLYRLKPRLYSRLRAQFFPIRFDPWVGQQIVTLLSFRMWLYFVAFDSLYNALLIIVISSVQALWTLKLWRWLPHKYSRIQSFHKNKRMACSSTDRFCDVSE